LELELKAFKEKLKLYSSKDTNATKFQEISEKKQKELEKITNEVKRLHVKLEEKTKQIKLLEDENLRIFDI
jgi:predicted RNase H-like nuclease (RuvC/YqgF family)